MPSAVPALPLFGQGVPVEDGDHGRRLAGQPQQHRRDGAAVLGAVEDAGQHDDRGHRLDAVGDRQQDRDGGGRAEAGQHADQHADDDADQAVEQVRRLQDDAEAVDDRIQEIHLALQNSRGAGSAGAPRRARRTRATVPRLIDDRRPPGLLAEEPQPHEGQQQRRDLEPDQRQPRPAKTTSVSTATAVSTLARENFSVSVAVPPGQCEHDRQHGHDNADHERPQTRAGLRSAAQTRA